MGLSLFRAGDKGRCRAPLGRDTGRCGQVQPAISIPSPGPLQMKELQLVLSEANESLRGLQEQLSQERQLRKDEVDNFSQKICQVSRQPPRSLGYGCPHAHGCATSSPRLTTCLGT